MFALVAQRYALPQGTRESVRLVFPTESERSRVQITAGAFFITKEKEMNTMKKRIFFFITGGILLIFSMLLTRSSFSALLTGSVIGIPNELAPSSLVVFSLLLISVVLLIFATLEKKIKLVSSIHQNESLRRLTEEATRNEAVQRELDHFVDELSKGHLAGLPQQGHIGRTDIYYLRGRRGGRLYYRKTEEGYEVVGKSAKGRNQDQVIQKLKELYSS